MRLTWLPLALVVFALFISAPAAAEGVSLMLAHDRFQLIVTETATGEDAQELREDMDMDDNGRVEASEAFFFGDGQSIRVENPEEKRACFEGADFVKAGGSGIRGFSSLNFTFQGAEGPVNSTRSVQHSIIMLFLLENRRGSPPVEVRFAHMDALGAMLPCIFMGSYGPGFDWGTWFSQYDWSGYSYAYEPTHGSVEAPAPTTTAAGGGSSSSETVRIGGMAGYGIDLATVQPTSVRRLWDGKGLLADSDSDMQTLATPEKISFTLTGGPVARGGSDSSPGVVVGSAVAGGVLGLAGLGLAATEFGRYKLLKWTMAVPLFTRFEKDEVLEHNTREQLYQYIRTNQGSSFSDLRRALELSNGTLVHHLRILESQEFVKPIRDGFRTRFYIRGPRIIPQAYLTRTQQAILETIQSNPGITQKELAALLGLPRESVFYHARKLETAGKLKVSKEGKWRKYFPALEPGPVAAGPPPAPSQA